MTVPEGVTSIYQRAFYGCSGIASYSLPSTLKYIGDEVFRYNSGLPRLSIPGSVTHIGYSSFIGCTRLTYLTFEDGTENLNIKTKRVKVRKNTTAKNREVNYDEFTDCPLSRLYLGRNLYGTNFYNKERLRRVTFGKDVTYLTDSLFFGCSAITELELPEKLRIVKNYVFFNCSGLESLSFPGSVDSIGYRCFENCKSLQREPR